jgi:hypothetical protein
MLIRLMTATMAVAMLAGSAVPAAATAPCRDAHGKYVKCAPKKPTAAHCKDAKGKFVKCSAPGAKPVK